MKKVVQLSLNSLILVTICFPFPQSGFAEETVIEGMEPQLFRDAILLIQNGEESNAIKALEQLRTGNNQSIIWHHRANFLLGYLYSKSDRIEGLCYWDKITDSNYVLEDAAIFYKAQLLERLDQPERAISVYKKIPEEFPASDFKRRSLFRIAEIFLDLEEYKKARHILNSFSGDAEELRKKLLLIKTYLGLKVYKNAGTYIHDLCVRHPLSVEARKAETCIDEIIKETGKRTFDLLPGERKKRLHTFLDNKYYLSAYNEARVIQKNFPSLLDDLEVKILIAKSLFHRNKFTESKGIFNSLGPALPKEFEPECLGYLGYISQRMNKNDVAQSYYRQLVTRFPEHPITAHFGVYMAQQFLDEGQFISARNIINALADQSISNELRPEYLWLRAWLHFLTDQPAIALSLLTRLGEDFPDSIYYEKTLFWRGKIASTMNKADVTCLCFKQLAKSMSPNYYSVRAQKLLEGYCSNDFQSMQKDNSNWDLARIEQSFIPTDVSSIVESTHWLRMCEYEILHLLPLYIDELDRLISKNKDVMFLEWKKALAYDALKDFNNSIPQFRMIYSYLSTRYHLFSSSDLMKKIYPLAFNDLIKLESVRYSLDPSLVAAVILQESSYDAQAKSRAGALGLMQIMPKVGRWLAKLAKVKYFRTNHLLKPEINIKLGCHQLKWLVRLFDNDRVAIIAAYNAGRSTVLGWQKRFITDDSDVFTELIPYGETKHFVKQVQRNETQYRLLYGF